MTIEIRPLNPIIGAEIWGADLANLTDQQFGEIHQASVAHGVIFFRDQPRLSPEQQIAFAGRFGPVHVHPASRGVAAEYPGLMKIRTTRETDVAAGNRWHSDVSCDEAPPSITTLQLHEIPPSGGDTLFSSMNAAYDALSERMKTLLDGLTAHHSGEDAYRRLFRFDKPGEASWPEADHPLVREHPDSHRPALYVNREFTERINGLPRLEAKALFGFLLDHAEQVAFQCRFVWSENAIAAWDNRCVQHHAVWDYWPHERRGHRVTAQGEIPIPWSGDPGAQRSENLRLSA